MAPRFIARELGSVIVGAVSVDAEGRPTDAEADDVDMRDQEQDQDQDVKEEEGKPSGQEDVKDALKQLSGELNKTLHDARFVIGDYISAAILPPLADGSVASPPPPPAARGPPPPRDGYRPRENGFGGRGGSGGGEWDRYGPGREGRGGRGGRFEDRGAAFPAGEWRRGEAPPERERDRDAYWSRGGGGRGGGRGRGRW
jgi:histone deacetylase complex subunit SAP18